MNDSTLVNRFSFVKRNFAYYMDDIPQNKHKEAVQTFTATFDGLFTQRQWARLFRMELQRVRRCQDCIRSLRTE